MRWQLQQQCDCSTDRQTVAGVPARLSEGVLSCCCCCSASQSWHMNQLLLFLVCVCHPVSALSSCCRNNSQRLLLPPLPCCPVSTASNCASCCCCFAACCCTLQSIETQHTRCTSESIRVGASVGRARLCQSGCKTSRSLAGWCCAFAGVHTVLRAGY